MRATFRNRPWEMSKGPPPLKFQITSYSHTANGIIAIEVVDTQLPKLNKSDLFKHNQYNYHSRQKQKMVNLKDTLIDSKSQVKRNIVI